MRAGGAVHCAIMSDVNLVLVAALVAAGARLTVNTRLVVPELPSTIETLATEIAGGTATK